MLQFLKERTFKANDVFLRAVSLLGKHYFSIAGLCFLIFLISSTSTQLSLVFEGTSDGVRFLLMVVFVILYFGLQLVLLKRAVHIVKQAPTIGFKGYIPSAKQFVNYLLGFVFYSVLALIAYLVVYVLCFPLLYLGVSIDTVRFEIHPFVTGVVMLIVVMRTVFYPFFIIEQDCDTWHAYKFSLAMTKGNVISLLFVVLAVSTIHILLLGAEYLGYSAIAAALGIVNAFIIIPLVSLVMSIVYVDMMKDYKGGDDPAVLDNII